MHDERDLATVERLGRYFASEVSRAERKSVAQPARAARGRRGRVSAGVTLSVLAAVTLIAIVARPGSPAPAPSALPGPVLAPSAAPTVSPPALLSGGCGDTTVFAPPGPTTYAGLGDLPWAPATPASAGLTAYFFTHGAPYLTAGSGSVRPDGGSNKVLWVSDGGSPTLRILAHRLDRAGDPVAFTLPASGAQFPSIIDLPTPGCWRLDLTLGTGTTASIALLVGPGSGQTPSPSPSPSDPLAALRRPIRTPAFQPGGSCPSTPIGRTVIYGSITYASGGTASGVNELQGEGPVYLGGLDESSIQGLPRDSHGWYGNKFLVSIDDRESGRVLLRAAKLDGPGGVTFNDGIPEVVVGDALFGGPAVAPSSSPGPRPAISRTFVLGINVLGPGCYVVQADSGSSSTSIIFRILETPSPDVLPRTGDPLPLLLARPLAAAPAATACAPGPLGPRDGFAIGTGTGTVFAAGDLRHISLATLARRSDGWALKTVWVNTDAAARPVVVRGVSANGTTVHFEGGIASGTNAYLYGAGDSGVTSTGVAPEWQQWPATTIFPAAGCYVMQVDGVDFTETFVVEVTR